MISVRCNTTPSSTRPIYHLYKSIGKIEFRYHTIGDNSHYIYSICKHIQPHGIVKTWHGIENTGSIESEISYIEGKKHGLHKNWYDNGQLLFHTLYLDNKSHGEHKHWYENGQLSFHYFYSHDILNGTMREWHENGQLAFQGRYKNGKMVGIWKEWYANGQLSFEGFYIGFVAVTIFAVIDMVSPTICIKH